ncbi:hypothetical protein StoSoilA2_20870 [Arthrobacter sp. StoSoilA2]|nr:hypothetical protein StoSoilA2_20870 [Arthrobacter sp. StoSoilA2]
MAQLLPDERNGAAKGMRVFNRSSTIPSLLAAIVAPLLLSTGGGGENCTAMWLCGAGLSLIGAGFTQLTAADASVMPLRPDTQYRVREYLAQPSSSERSTSVSNHGTRCKLFSLGLPEVLIATRPICAEGHQ